MSKDTLKLNQSKMFAKIRAGLTAERQHTQDLLDCKDDMLFAWDSQESCLLVVNWRAAAFDGLKKVNYQSLMPSSPQSFQVERVLASGGGGSLVALAGPRGATILELPLRRERHGQFMDGKAKIMCRSANLDAYYFNNNPHLKLHQLRWHPGSPTDSHLMLLLSDNTIRVYNNATLRHVWYVGPTPLKVDANSSLPSFYSLGETAVDFDIAPAVNVVYSNTAWPNATVTSTRGPEDDTSIASENQMRLPQAAKYGAVKVEWPIVVLRENGNIYVLMAGMDTEQPRLQGPLTITPESVHNYGLDSCALLVIPSLPPSLVIAESTGKLHHALFLEAETAEDSFSEIDASLEIHPCEWKVHVLETVELELGLPISDTVAGTYHCPIHLKRDLVNEQRYFAYHNAGLHVISVNFIGELQRYAESDMTTDLAVLSTPSDAEYIVCTKIKTGEPINAVLGFVLLQMPSDIVLLLGSGQVISLKLVIDPKMLIQPPLRRATRGSSNQRAANRKFVEDQDVLDLIKGMLRYTVTQPISSVDKSTTQASLQCYALLMQAIDSLPTDYQDQHKLIHNEIVKRLRKEQQHRNIKQLEQERVYIREQAHRLADRFEEISGQQEQLTKKCHDLVRLANTSLPSNSFAEQEFGAEIDRINRATQTMSLALQRARVTINTQCYHISKFTVKSRPVEELPKQPEHTINEILSQMTDEIDGQTMEVKDINNVVHI